MGGCDALCAHMLPQKPSPFIGQLHGDIFFLPPLPFPPPFLHTLLNHIMSRHPLHPLLMIQYALVSFAPLPPIHHHRLPACLSFAFLFSASAGVSAHFPPLSLSRFTPPRLTPQPLVIHPSRISSSFCFSHETHTHTRVQTFSLILR